MDFGKLVSVDGVDFTLPDDPSQNPDVLQSAVSTAGAPAIRLGSPQWGHAGYVGRIYPEGTPKSDFLSHYARHFGTVELNSTFYGVRDTSLSAWREAVPPAFRFCPKMPQRISHDLSLDGVEAETDTFIESLDHLGDRLGCVWMLMPERFAPPLGRRLVDFVRRWPTTMPLAVELRHPGWFGERRMLDALMGVFAEAGTSTVITDVAGRRDVLHLRLTSRCVLVRFVGNALHPTDFTRLDAWAERIARWLDAGLEQVYLFLHQPQEDLNLELADHVGEALERLTGVSIQRPERIERFEQGRLF